MKVEHAYSSAANPAVEIMQDAYEVAIAGGGLAGLSLAIQLKKAGHSVILFEKETYPFHRVCGEYISMESWDFLTTIGLDLEGMGVSHINKLQLSSPGGRLLHQRLPLGGFGVSRNLLDFTLCQIARKLGVTVMENTRVNNIHFDNERHLVETSQGNIVASVACGAFGKRSNIDIKWKRPFVSQSKNKLNNFIGVKYHIKSDHPPDTIALHLFPQGYCGIVRIEKDIYNLCYLTTAANLQRAGGNIAGMERTILGVNPHLKKILSECERVHEDPLTISQISFDKKDQVTNHVLLAGDAAGMITPLCGNGMSIPTHTRPSFLKYNDDIHSPFKLVSMQWHSFYTLLFFTITKTQHMKRLISSNCLKSAFLFITLCMMQVLVYAQDTTGASSSSSTKTTTTTTTTWYTQPWVWVVGAVLLLVLIVALRRGNNSSTTERTTVIRDADRKV
ncbi:MAG: NAD(P)/FAD-dependent oxidoreductase [Chitinophagaceae bacterium]|nr:MAG: NAD(P)/FAD-dependent oxidoreductase [Chitinophagaceae bacterium]